MTIRSKGQAYGDRREWTAPAGYGLDVSTPVAGFYRHRFGRDTIEVGVRIWHGPPLDPVTGEELDRSWRWQAEVNGCLVDFERVWPACALNVVSEADYRTFCARQSWAKESAPKSAYAQPGRKIDRLSRETPLLF